VTALDVDEVVGQLLASEGFASVEEIAYVDIDDLASIEGFDEETANELQTRAREYLDKLEAEQDEERKALGVEDALKEVPGITTSMLVALGKADMKTVEDFAGAVPDELTGWVERKDGETKRHPGALDGFDLSRADAEAMIIRARVKAGWITEADLNPPEAEPAEAEAAPASA
jgi:N utilization substance protein A